MKYDFSTILLDMDGEPLKDEKGNPLTLGRASSNALMVPIPNENRDPTINMRRLELALRVRENKVLEITTEEASEIKLCVAAAYAPIVSGRVSMIMEAKH